MYDEIILEQAAKEITDVEVQEVPVLAEEDLLELYADVEQVPVVAEESEVVEIDVSEGFTGDVGLKISADHSRYLPNQHTIGAITGLREELDEIERLKPVYSDGRNQANYYLWEDENPTKENRDGYFVAVSKDDNRIHICASAEDEFGVTVSNAGLIGGQSDATRDECYGLVVHSGVVPVKCEIDVAVNDYVVSDNYGVAKKTDGTYGYLVTAISNIDGTKYAFVSLTMPSTQMQRFSKTTQDVAERMDSAEINIATAISVANAAYNKAKDAEESVNHGGQIVGGQIEDVLGRVDNVENQIENLGGTLGSVSQVATEAYNISNTAANTAENIRRQAVETANDAQAAVNDLIADIAPITTWTDPESGNKGADYLVNHVNNNLATKTEVAAVETLTENNFTAISQNAEHIELITTSIDKYSVGEWSQAYGLTWEQAKSILKKDMLYIPTVEHDEFYEDYPTSDNKHEFTRGYYYIWNGNYWVESVAPLVYFSAEYVQPSEPCEYWYRETDEVLERPDDITGDMITYDAQALYMWMNNKWTKVNILDGNVTNRVVSAIKQTANQIAIDVANARGDIAALEAKVDDNGATMSMVASVVTVFKDSDGNPIGITGNIYATKDEITVFNSGEYYAVGESAPYDIYTNINGELTKVNYLYYDGANIMQPNTASIVNAVNNEGDSSIGISADKIIMTGTTQFLSASDVGINGMTQIDGGRLKTGAIQSFDYTAGADGYSTKGFQIHLENRTIFTPNFKLDADGNVSMRGHLEAKTGKIGPFDVTEANLKYTNPVGYTTDFIIHPTGFSLGSPSLPADGNNAGIDLTYNGSTSARLFVRGKSTLSELENYGTAEKPLYASVSVSGTVVTLQGERIQINGTLSLGKLVVTDLVVYNTANICGTPFA